MVIFENSSAMIQDKAVFPVPQSNLLLFSAEYRQNWSMLLPISSVLAAVCPGACCAVRATLGTGIFRQPQRRKIARLLMETSLSSKGL